MILGAEATALEVRRDGPAAVLFEVGLFDASLFDADVFEAALFDDARE